MQEAQLRNSMNQGGFEEILRRMETSQVQTSSAATIDKTSELYELCLELETILVKNLISSMRATVSKTELFETGFAGEIYEDMLYDEYAKIYARNANLGFAEMAYRELSSYSV